HRHPEQAMVMQGKTIDGKRRHGRHLRTGGLRRDYGLFFDGVVAPAAGPAEFCNNGRCTLDAYLVDPVLVAVESEHAAIAFEAEALERVKNVVRLQPLEGE